MFTATVPCGDGRLDGGAAASTAGVVALLDSAPVLEAPVGSVLPCSQDPDLWFADTPTELERAKRLCSTCPVLQECLAGALARHEPWGVWGGEIFERGQVVARKRPRGRPRKSDSARIETRSEAA